MGLACGHGHEYSRFVSNGYGHALIVVDCGCQLRSIISAVHCYYSVTCVIVM